MESNEIAKYNEERKNYKIMIRENLLDNDLCDGCERLCERLNERKKFIEKNAERFIHNGIRVYKMNDYEFFASKWSIEETSGWYKEEYGIDEVDNPTEEIYSCDLDKEVVWRETTDENDLKAIGELDEVKSYLEPIPSIGDLKRIGSKIYKCVSFRQALVEDGDFKEPYCLATQRDEIGEKNQEIRKLHNEIKKLKEDKQNLIIQLAEIEEENKRLR